MKHHGVIVITGGSQGLGKAIAGAVVKRGIPVALIARDLAQLEAVKRELDAVSGAKPLVSVHAADLTQAHEAEKALSEILALHHAVRGLVNNAGTWTGGKSVLELSHGELQRSLDLNFFTAFHTIKALLSVQNPSSKQALSIMNIGATSSLHGWAEVAAFCIAKGALRTLSQSLARELGPQGVHVSHLVIDGLLDNPRTRGLNPGVPSDRFMNLSSTADTILHVMLEQHPSAWTFELEVRPHHEEW